MMDSLTHHRISIRLHEYDFCRWGGVTVCLQARLSLFGRVIHGKRALKDAAVIA